MTLEAWVKPADVPNAWRDVIYKGDDNYYLEAASDRETRASGAGVFDGTRGHVFAASPLPVDTWTHLAITYDGAALRLYLNGGEVAEVPQTGSYRLFDTPARARQRQRLRPVLRRAIDEVRVYNVALNADEIRTDISAPIASRTPADSTPPLAPGTPNATAKAPTQVDLSWDTATDDVGVAKYRIEHCQGSG